ncbi:MAG: hypothetical protein V7696_08895 [Halioglobus sp.]
MVTIEMSRRWAINSLNVPVRYFLSVLALLAISLWVYWPGQNGPLMLDDRGSLFILEALDENPAHALDYILGDNSGKFGRPVSMASFVVEKIFFDSGIAGQKRVNIVLHTINGLLVVWLMGLLLRFHRVPQSDWFALLLGFAWLLAPLNVSTVLYVVQRMAMLAATFMLAACIAYTYWRQSAVAGASNIFAGVIALLCCVLAPLSKENGLLIIPIVVLLEFLWFRPLSIGRQSFMLFRLSGILVAVGAALIAVALVVEMDGIIAGYAGAGRNYGLYERLMTEGRVLWDYCAQTFWPQTFRMGLFHDDYDISRSLFDPISTLYALMGWVLVIAAALFFSMRAWGTPIAFCIFWFLVGHSMESTFLALELYFEHRNYFPGIGLFLLVGTVIGLLVRSFPVLGTTTLAWLLVYVVYLALQTSSQVQIWSSAPLLRINHVVNHPESERANEEMSIHLAGVGALEEALIYMERAALVSTRERLGDKQLREIGLYCLARRELPVAHLASLGQNNPERPFAAVSVLNGLLGLFKEGKCPNFDERALADRFAELFLHDPQVSRASPKMFLVLAGLENRLQRYDSAYQYTELSLSLSPYDVTGLLMKLHFSTALDRSGEIDRTFRELQALDAIGALSISQRETLNLYQ